MPLPIATAVAVYLTMWWVTLFAVLPLGVRSAHESDDAPEAAGNDPGAPIAPRLLMKAALTTVVSAVLFGLLIVFMRITE